VPRLKARASKQTVAEFLAVINDPEYESKAADILGLYLNPPQHAAVFSVDKKTSIQALDRLDPVLPLSPGRPNATVLSTTDTAGFRCTRPWTPRPAASTGKLRLATAAVTSLPSSKKWRHCARPGSRFISFSTTLSAHKTQLVQTSSNGIRACSFTSPRPIPLGSTKASCGSPKSSAMSLPAVSLPRVTDLARELRRYINAYSANARPIRWKYSDPSRRLSTNEFTAIVH
jgi:hypothetical protein